MRWSLILAASCVVARTPAPDPPITVRGVVDLIGIEGALHVDYGTLVYVAWTQSDAADTFVEYSVDPGEWRRSPTRALGAGSHQEILLGAPYDTEVAWRLVAVHPGGEVRTPTQLTWTANRPSALPVARVVVADPSSYESGMPYVLVSVSYDDTFHGEHAVVVLDRQGRVVWYHPSERRFSAMHPRIDHAGSSFLFDQSSFWGGQRDGGAASYVLSMGIDGTVSRRWDTPGLYHAFTDLPGGGLAYPSHRTLPRSGAAGERLVVQTVDGSSRELLDCDVELGARCGSNTLTYDAERDVFLYSLFTAEEVWEVDAADGSIRARFGRTSPDWTFDPPASGFWFQHGPTYTSAGTLMVSSHAGEDDDELVVREYEVDTTNRVLRQVWTFGEGEGVHGAQMGEAHRLPGGNTLHNYGTHAVLREITPRGEVVWDVRWEGAEYQGARRHAIGRSAPILAPDLYGFRRE